MPYYYTQERKLFSPKGSKRKNQADNNFSVTPTFKNNKRNALSNLNYNSKVQLQWTPGIKNRMIYSQLLISLNLYQHQKIRLFH